MKKKEAIENILDHFDFEKVHRTMTALDWTWHSTDGVPEISDLRKQARRLLKDVAKRKEDRVCTGTGGFEVYKEDGVLELKFVVAEWDEEFEIKKNYKNPLYTDTISDGEMDKRNLITVDLTDCKNWNECQKVMNLITNGSVKITTKKLKKVE